MEIARDGDDEGGRRSTGNNFDRRRVPRAPTPACLSARSPAVPRRRCSRNNGAPSEFHQTRRPSRCALAFGATSSCSLCTLKSCKLVVCRIVVCVGKRRRQRSQRRPSSDSPPPLDINRQLRHAFSCPVDSQTSHLFVETLKQGDVAVNDVPNCARSMMTRFLRCRVVIVIMSF